MSATTRLRHIQCALALLCCGAAFALAAPRDAGAVTWVIKGRGFGHGVGMSQYGAYGFAQNGRGYRAILRHYYRGTRIATAPRARTVRVLLEVDRGDVYFRRAHAACGRRLAPRGLYRAHRVGNRVTLLGSRGRFLANCGPKLRARTRGVIRVGTHGAYRGTLEVVPTNSDPTALNAINAVNVNAYVMGVVPEEMLPSWPLEALRVQAVAARTYALTSQIDGNGFGLYSDTRSQVYEGKDAETERTNRAVRSTRNQLVMYRGRAAQTFYFSTSGGRTESGFLGAAEVPYLRSVRDPFDFHSPLHTWTLRYDGREMQARLGPYVKGVLRGIRIVKRGDSPRIDRAVLIGSGGRTFIRGDTLQFALDAFDRWMTFRKRR